MQIVVGLCATKNGTTIDESVQAGENGIRILALEEVRVPAKNARGFKVILKLCMEKLSQQLAAGGCGRWKRRSGEVDGGS